MSGVAAQYRRAAAGFTARVDAMPAEGWERPAPCEGWVARDVVRHLVSWVSGFFEGAGGPKLASDVPVATDPAAAWHAFDELLQAALDDPAVAGAVIDHPHVGPQRFDEAVASFVIGDVVVHTWDLARAGGLDERLDPALVHEMLTAMQPAEPIMRSSGQYGPRVEVPDDADEQTMLLAFTGRMP